MSTNYSQNGSYSSEKGVILHYYPIRGVAQPIRILLNYLEIQYSNNYLQKNEENQAQTGFRVGLPMLQDGDFKVYQQISIMNYLCMKGNKQHLLGLTPQDSAKINEMFFKYSVQKKKIMSLIMQGLKYLQDPNLNKKQICQKSLKKVIQECKFIQVCLKKVIKSKKYVFDYLTLIDFLFYETCFYVDGFYKDVITKDSQYYGFIKYKNYFEKHDFYQKNKKKIESNNIFFEFTSPSLIIMVSKLWKGCNHDNLYVKANCQKME